MGSWRKTGNMVWLLYDEEGPWHQRLMLAPVAGSLWIIATPDMLIYTEDLSSENADLAGLVWTPSNGGLPSVFKRGTGYSFGAMTANDRRDLVSQGRDLAPVELAILRDLPAAAAAGPSGLAAAADGGRAPRPALPVGDLDEVNNRGPDLAALRDGLRVAVDDRQDRQGLSLGAGDATPGSVWRSMETNAVYRVGDVVSTAGGKYFGLYRGVAHPSREEMGVARSSEEETSEDFILRLGLGAGSDARILPVVVRKIDGQRERSFESAVDAAEQVELDTFGVRGPRTAGWCMRFLARQHTHPDDYHRNWKSRHKLAEVDWGVAIHALVMRGVSLALCNDQVDGMNMTVIEHLFREAQLVEYHYHMQEKDEEEKKKKDKKHGGPTAEESDLFRGSLKSGFAAMVCPELTEYIAKQLERDVNIQKQTRKAREERTLARK